ncbi:MAG: FG-GAP repeat protein [Anaerolineae bacterium]
MSLYRTTARRHGSQHPVLPFFFLALALTLLLLAGAPAATAAAQHKTTLADLPSAAQALVSRTLGQDDVRYQLTSTSDGYAATNPAQQIAAQFDAQGAQFTVQGHAVRMTLQSWGAGADRQPMIAAMPQVTANRVAWTRGPLTEWYINGPGGWEQGFTVTSPLPPSPDRSLVRRGDGGEAGEALTLALDLGGWTARVDGDGLGATLASGDGAAALRYTGLAAVDASGRALHTWMEAGAGSGTSLLVRVDATGAQYPLTIDPWVQSAQLTASDGAAGDYLGTSVAMSSDGSTLVAGASDATIGSNTYQEAVYVFVKPGGGWSSGTETAKLTASDGAANDILGVSVAASSDGSTIVAGAPDAKFGTSTNPGAAYVFIRPGGGWSSGTETAKLTASDGAVGDYLGSVAMSADGNTIIAGACHVMIGSHTWQGAVYVYVKPDGGWATTSTFTAKLTASDGGAYDFLGREVAVSADGSTLVAGAYLATVGGHSEQGAAYVYVRPEGGWSNATETAKLTASDGAAFDWLGYSMAMSSDGSTIVAGAPQAKIGSNTYQGAAYVFARPGGGWSNGTETAKLIASDGAMMDFLGCSVAVISDGSTIVAGAPFAQIGSNSNQGAAYVYVRPGGGWSSATETAKLTASNGAAGDCLGYSVGVSPDGSTIIAGAPYAKIGSKADQGEVYVFDFTLSTLTPTNTPTNSPTATSTPTATPTSSPTATSTPTNTLTNSPTATDTPTDTPTNSPTITSTPTPTIEGTATPTSTDIATLTPTPTTTPPNTVVESNSPLIQYDGWRGAQNANANGGSYRVSNVPGSKVVYKFTGASIRWITMTGPDQGKATVTIGANTYTVDLYSAAPQWNVVKTYSGLAAGAHTITIKVSATKNAASTGVNVVVDAFSVNNGTPLQENSLLIQYDNWTGKSSASASGGSYRATGPKLYNRVQSYAQLTFTGTSITWITAKGPSYGKAIVTIDGMNKGTFDLYRSTAQWQAAIQFTNLGAGTHVIKILPQGTRNAAATSANVVVDAFSGPIIPSFNPVTAADATDLQAMPDAPDNSDVTDTSPGTGANGFQSLWDALVGWLYPAQMVARR